MDVDMPNAFVQLTAALDARERVVTIRHDGRRNEHQRAVRQVSTGDLADRQPGNDRTERPALGERDCLLPPRRRD